MLSPSTRNNPTGRAGAYLALALALAACGDTPAQHADSAVASCDLETRADTYVVGLEKIGTNGFKTRLLDSQPAPPAKGDNTMLVQVLDDSDTPVSDVVMSVTPFMPDHGHGTSITAAVTPGANAGEYAVTPVNLWMPGLWEIRINLADASGTDQVVYAFCIEG